MSASSPARNPNLVTADDFWAILERYESYLAQFESQINDLNVYPVPDSDTGTNALVTVRAGISGLASVESESDSLTEAIQIFAESAGQAALGNSGTILAEYFRGLATDLSATATGADWHHALSVASRFAFEAVSVPVSGTILTVAEAIASTKSQGDLQSLLVELRTVAKSELMATTSQLPQLASAGVVDAGALVLVLFHEVVSSYLNDHEVEISYAFSCSQNSQLDIYDGPDYELTFLLEADETVRDALAAGLSALGESLTIIRTGQQFKVHIHTDLTTEVLELAENFGPVTSVTKTSLKALVD